MEGFQTNPVVFVAICFAWLIVIASFGAYKAFFKDPEISQDDSEVKAAESVK